MPRVTQWLKQNLNPLGLTVSEQGREARRWAGRMEDPQELKLWFNSNGGEGQPK